MAGRVPGKVPGKVPMLHGLHVLGYVIYGYRKP